MPQTRRLTRIVRAPKQKEERLLQAAHEVIIRRGFDGTRMEEIAARAGVGKGTVYNLFRSKDELLLSLVAQNFDESRKLIDDSVAAVSEPWAGIRTAWETLMRRVFPELAGRWLLLYQTVGLPGAGSWLTPPAPVVDR